MEFPREVTDVEEVIIDAASFDEGALAGRDEVVDERREAQRKHFSYDLRDAVDKTYGPVVADRLGPIFFRDEYCVSFVEEVEVLASRVV
jgi:hypothetical protein